MQSNCSIAANKLAFHALIVLLAKLNGTLKGNERCMMGSHVTQVHAGILQQEVLQLLGMLGNKLHQSRVT